MADSILLKDSSGEVVSPMNLLDQSTDLTLGAEKKPIPKIDPTKDYVQNVEGMSFMDLKDDSQFQTDLLYFFNGNRYNYSKDELVELGPEGLAEKFVEHMRFQDTNEATAIKDLYYAKDNRNNSTQELAAFGRLMSAWDGSEDAGTSLGTAVGDYAAGILSAPSTWTSLVALPFTLGAGTVASQLAKQTAKKGVQLQLRKVLSSVIAKKTAAEVLKKNVTATTLKGVAAGAVVEGALGYGQIETQEATRDQVIENYVGKSAGDKALAVGFQSAFGGTLAGFGSWMNVKQANKAIDTLLGQQEIIDSRQTAGAINAVTALKSKLKNPQADKRMQDVLTRIVKMTNMLEKKAIPTDGKALDPTRVAEGNKILTEIFAKEPKTNIIGGLSGKTIQGITAAASDIVDKLDISPDERISSAIARALSKPSSDPTSITTGEMTDILNKYAITREEFSNVFLAELSEAGRTLGQAAQVSKAFKKSEKLEAQKLLNDITVMGKVGVSTIDDILAQQTVDAASKSNVGTMLYKGLQEVDAARIAFMTSQLATTARNVGFSVARLGVDFSDQVFKTILSAGTVSIGKLIGKETVPYTPARNTFSMLRGMTTDKNMALVSRVMLEADMPAVYKKLFRDTTRVEVATGADNWLAKTSRAVNIANSATDHVFKQAAFYASIDRQLAELADPRLGYNFKEFAESGRTFLDLDAILGDGKGSALLDRAGRDALDFTFQKGYENSDTIFGQGANFVINLNRKLPFFVSGLGGMPFPRYVANHMEFIHDYMPIIGTAKGLAEGTAKLVYDPKFLFSKDKGQMERWSKQLTGASMLLGAYHLRASQGGETGFSDFKYSENGDVSKMAPILGAFNGHMLVADAIYRYNNDLPLPSGGKLLSDSLEVLTGMNTLGFNTGLVEALYASFQKGEYTDVAKRKLADVISTGTYPLAVAKDFLGQYDPEKSYTWYNPDVQGDGNIFTELQTWGEFKSRVSKNIPQYDWLNHARNLNSADSLPRYSPFNSRPIGTVNPAMKQIIGIDVRKQSSIQKEIARLNLREWDLYRNSTVPNPTTRYVIEKRLSSSLNESWLRHRDTPLSNYEGKTYDELATNQQQAEFTRFIKKEIQEVAKSTDEDWKTYSAAAPKSAAGYIRNMFMIQGKQDIDGEPRYDVAAQLVPGGEFNTAEEYLSESISLTDEIKRRQFLMLLADREEDKVEGNKN